MSPQPCRDAFAMRLLYFDARGELRLTRDKAKVPGPYAILSHTWGDDEDEVTIEDLEQQKGKEKPGYAKLLFCANRAKQDGLDYCWVDTCCIDKRSSAELSEAINSMFAWYRDAEVCYVYLQDLAPVSQMGHATMPGLVAFERCRWWTRSWTLQELLAPRSLLFFAADESYYGTKGIVGHPNANDRLLDDRITRITGINASHLSHQGPLQYLSIAERMSWAAKRKTTRIEDEAYCLLGLFDVNMPLLYGEGNKAFLRLQKEIIRTSDDHSIFAWYTHTLSETTTISRFTGLLSPSPANFVDTDDIDGIPSRTGPYSMTNKGLEIRLPLFKGNDERIRTVDVPVDASAVYAILSCSKFICLLAIPVAQPSSYDCDLFHVPGPFGEEILPSVPRSSVYGVCRDNRFRGPIAVLGPVDEFPEATLYVSPCSDAGLTTALDRIYFRSAPDG